MKVRIGSTKYDISTTKSVYQEELGLCDMDEAVILINNKHSVQTNKQTLWHEIVHAIMHEMAEDELCNDEAFVDRLGKMLYGFYEDNKLDKLYDSLK